MKNLPVSRGLNGEVKRYDVLINGIYAENQHLPPRVNRCVLFIITRLEIQCCNNSRSHFNHKICVEIKPEQRMHV